MAQRDPHVEYLVKTVRGKRIQTLDIVLYAPDGSVFTMPHGGTTTTYVAKGYKLKPDAQWNALNEVHEAEKAKSLKVSDFQREIKNREVELVRKKNQLAIEAQMNEVEAQMADAEAELEALENPPKAKAKAKVKA